LARLGKVPFIDEAHRLALGAESFRSSYEEEAVGELDDQVCRVRCGRKDGLTAGCGGPDATTGRTGRNFRVVYPSIGIRVCDGRR
jgi:hypothetical protein